MRKTLTLATSAFLLFGSCSPQQEPAIVRIAPTVAPAPTEAPRTPKRVSRTASPSPLHPAHPQGRSGGSIPAMIREVFGQHGDAAVRVSSCETGGTFNPAVVNSSGHTGLFQISPRWHSGRATRLGFTWAQMREARPNILVAWDLFKEQGWGPWTCASILGIR